MGSSRRAWRFLSLATVVLCLSACDPPEDQTKLKPEHVLVADPAPIAPKDKPNYFRDNNDRHKILLGVFDTGVDYNHPYLADHMHYELDKEGKPVSAGIDFLTLEDKWASHRLIQTSLYEWDGLTERQQKAAKSKFKSKKNYEDDRRRNKLGRICSLGEMVKMDPRLGKFLHPYRDIGRELSRGQHGTHVAGLMSYDNPEIGLIPYRVLPYHQTEEDEAAYEDGKADKFVSNFEKAVEHASKAGVRIINLSLGGSYEKPTNTNDSAYEEKLEKFRSMLRMLTEGLTKIAAKYPKMLFVAAAGNDSGWSDNKARLQYPCGVEAENVLCVGALDKDGEKSGFTNVPLNNVDLVFAPGVKIISTIPNDACTHLWKMAGTVLNPASDWGGFCRYDLGKKEWVPDAFKQQDYKELVATLYKQCSKPQLAFDAFSGTSMATPIVSRIAAEVWLENPKLKPTEVIKAMKGHSVVDKTLNFTTYKLRAKLPSWYALFSKAQVGEGNAAVPDLYLAPPMHLLDWTVPPVVKGWFEFVVNQLGK